MSNILYLSQHMKLIINHKSQEITYKRIYELKRVFIGKNVL